MPHWWHNEYQVAENIEAVIGVRLNELGLIGQGVGKHFESFKEAHSTMVLF